MSLDTRDCQRAWDLAYTYSIQPDTEKERQWA